MSCSLKKHSLRCRLLGSALLWVGMALVGAGVLLTTQTEKFLYAQLDDNMALYLDELTAYLDIDASGVLRVSQPLVDPRFNYPYSGYYWQARSGDQYLRSRSVWDSVGSLALGIGPEGKRLIVCSRDIQFGSFDTPLTLTVAIDPGFVEQTRQRLFTVTMSTLVILGTSVLALLWLLIRWALQPLEHLREDMASIRTGEKERLDGPCPEEVQGVVDDLNKLLFHYTELLERARTHTGNLAHALKTPLTIIRNQSETLPQSEQKIFLPAIQQLQDRIDYHLSRARLAGSVRILAVQSSPVEVVDGLTMVMEKAYYERDVFLVNEMDDALHVAVDARDLEEMLGNLIDNAFKWSKGLIRVHASTLSNLVEIIIDDDGPGLDQQQCEEVLKRGIRMDEKTHGSGLGLSIVVDIAHSYRGSIKLSRSCMGGLSARLTLPLVQVATPPYAR